MRVRPCLRVGPGPCRSGCPLCARGLRTQGAGTFSTVPSSVPAHPHLCRVRVGPHTRRAGDRSEVLTSQARLLGQERAQCPADPAWVVPHREALGHTQPPPLPADTGVAGGGPAVPPGRRGEGGGPGDELLGRQTPRPLFLTFHTASFSGRENRGPAGRAGVPMMPCAARTCAAALTSPPSLLDEPLHLLS